MLQFQVHGYGRDSGQRRKRTYKAKDEKEAILKAGEDGTIVERIEQLPDEPATERQIVYARGIGLAFPSDITKQEMSDLLTRYESEDEPSPARLCNWARDLGVLCSDYSGKVALFERITEALKEPGREKDLALWFTYMVLREFQHANWYHPADSGFDKTFVQNISSELTEDEKVISSIKRYSGFELISFGEKTDSDGTVHVGGSKKTIAYMTTAGLIRKKLGIQERPAPMRNLRDEFIPLVEKKNNPTGCATVIGVIILILIVMFLLRTSS